MNRDAYRMLKEIGLQRRFIVMTILRLPFDTLNAILTANIMQRFTDMIVKNGRESLWTNFLIFMALSVLLFGYNCLVWSTYAVKTGVLMQSRLRERIFDRIMSLPVEELEGAFGSEWFTRLNNDVDKACNYLTGAIHYMHMVIAILNVIVSSVIMLLLNVDLYVIGALCLLPFFLLNTLVISRKISVYKKKSQQNLVEYTAWLDAAVQNGEMLAVFDGGEFVRGKIAEKSGELQKQNMKVHSRVALCTMSSTVSGLLGYLAMLCRGDELIGEERIDFGMLFKMTQYRGNLVMSVNCIYDCTNNMKGDKVGIDRVNEVLTDISKAC